MININLESWCAIAPGLTTSESWQDWFDSESIEADAATLDLKQVPAMLRRRFKLLGKVASLAAFNVQKEGECLPSVFASRHGDTELTLSLLETIAKDEPLSPTGFSLAVHNAVGGLLSIVRKDKSPMTAIAATNGLVVNALFEVQAQLQAYERVLCVIYDVPLPAFYQPYALSLPFPLAIAFIASRDDSGHGGLTMRVGESRTTENQESVDMLDLVRLLHGNRDAINLPANQQHWHLEVTA